MGKKIIMFIFAFSQPNNNLYLLRGSSNCDLGNFNNCVKNIVENDQKQNLHNINSASSTLQIRNNFEILSLLTLLMEVNQFNPILCNLTWPLNNFSSFLANNYCNSGISKFNQNNSSDSNLNGSIKESNREENIKNKIYKTSLTNKNAPGEMFLIKKRPRKETKTEAESMPNSRLIKNHKLVFVHSKKVYQKGNNIRYAYKPHTGKSNANKPSLNLIKEENEIDLEKYPEQDSQKNCENSFSQINENPILYNNEADEHSKNRNDKKNNSEDHKLNNQSRGSKFRGVSRNGNQWQVLIMVHKKKRYVGSYSNEEDAARHYDKVAIQFHGNRTKTNYFYTEDDIERIKKEPLLLKIEETTPKPK